MICGRTARLSCYTVSTGPCWLHQFQSYLWSVLGNDLPNEAILSEVGVQKGPTKIIRYAEAGEAPWFTRQSKVVKPCCCDPFLFFAHPKLHFRFFEKLRVMPASAKFCAHLSNKKLWSSERTTAGTKLYKHSKCRAVFCARNLWKLRRSWETVWVVDWKQEYVSDEGREFQAGGIQHFHCTGHSTLEIGHCRINTRGPRMMSMICQPDATQTGFFPGPRRLCAVVSNKRQQGCPLHFNIHCSFLVLSYFLTSSLTVCFPVSFFGTLNWSEHVTFHSFLTALSLGSLHLRASRRRMSKEVHAFLRPTLSNLVALQSWLADGGGHPFFGGTHVEKVDGKDGRYTNHLNVMWFNVPWIFKTCLRKRMGPATHSLLYLNNTAFLT